MEKFQEILPHQVGLLVSNLTRDIKQIIWHCSASQGDLSAVDIDKMHKNRGWSGLGYHAVFRRDGSIQMGRSWNSNGAHAYGYNNTSIGPDLER